MGTGTTDDNSPLSNETLDHDLSDELDVLRRSRDVLQSKVHTMEESMLELRQERDDALEQASHLQILLRDTLLEKDTLLIKASDVETQCRNKEEVYKKMLEEESLMNEELRKEVSFLKHLVERLEFELENVESRSAALLKLLISLNKIKEAMVRIVEELDSDEEEVNLERLNEEDDDIRVEDGELKATWKELLFMNKLASEAEIKAKKYKCAKEKEKKELQSSVVSLTEENRDMNSLLRVALMEKEAVEKKLKEGTNDQKRAALLQIAERGLRGVGFGFMIGGGGELQAQQESLVSNTPASSNTSTKSDGSENEEEIDTLGSIVEKIMKNLRSEILELRRSMAECSSENERMERLTAKQSQEIAGMMLYVRELEERERVLQENLEKMDADIRVAESEVARWREACELEVKAGRSEIEEREKVVGILRKELEKTRAALDTSEGKVQLKEELAHAAMVAQAAAERSLQLADSRSAQLRDRIETLTKQVEEADGHRRLRRVCWPLRLHSRFPDMHSLLHHFSH